MAFWFCIFLLFAVGDSKPANPINQTDLQAAMADMRTQSYHGFVILLKIVNKSISFVLSHLILTGTRVQASAVFSEWNSGSLKQAQQDHQHHLVQKIKPLFLNNANIVTPSVSVALQVCVMALPRLWRSTTFMVIPVTLHIDLRDPGFMGYRKKITTPPRPPT